MPNHSNHDTLLSAIRVAQKLPFVQKESDVYCILEERLDELMKDLVEEVQTARRGSIEYDDNNQTIEREELVYVKEKLEDAVATFRETALAIRINKEDLQHFLDRDEYKGSMVEVVKLKNALSRGVAVYCYAAEHLQKMINSRHNRSQTIYYDDAQEDWVSELADYQPLSKTKAQEVRTAKTRVLHRNNPFADVSIANQQFLYVDGDNAFSTLSFSNGYTVDKIEKEDESYLAMQPNFKVAKSKSVLPPTTSIYMGDTISTVIQEEAAGYDIVYV